MQRRPAGAEGDRLRRRQGDAVSSLTEKTLFTEHGQFVGTPEYMSPEQAEVTRAATSTRARDVYSLGVVLYELLVGALPFDADELRSAGYRRDPADHPRSRSAQAEHALSSLGVTASEVASRRRTIATLARDLAAISTGSP